MATPKVSIPSYGASRSTGGIFRGHAHGNTFNMADASEVQDEINLHTDNVVEKPEKGKIHFYISNLSLAEVDIMQSSFTTTIHDKIKAAPRSSDFQLSDEPKNTKNGTELIGDQCYISWDLHY